MNFTRFLFVAGAAASAVFIPACGDSAAPLSVEVKVTLDGAPVEKASVTLMPLDATAASGRMEGGATDATGKAKVSAPRGKYRVLVSKTEAVMENMSPKDGNKSMIDMMKKSMTGGNKGGSGGPPKAGGPSKGNEPKNLLPAKYGTGDSPLTLTIPPEKTPVEFALTK